MQSRSNDPWSLSNDQNETTEDLASPALADIAFQLAIILILAIGGVVMLVQNAEIDPSVMKGQDVPETGERVFLEVFVKQDDAEESPTFSLVINSSPRLIERSSEDFATMEPLFDKLPAIRKHLLAEIEKNPEFRLQQILLCPPRFDFESFLKLYGNIKARTGGEWHIAAYSPEHLIDMESL